MAATETISAQRPDSPLFHQLGSRRLTPSSSSILRAAPVAPRSSSAQFLPSTSSEPWESTSTSPRSSSLNSSPRSSTLDLSKTSSFTSTPTSAGFSLDSESDEDDIDLPNYANLSLSPNHRSYAKPSDDDLDVPEISTTTDTTQSDSPLPTPVVADDTMIKQQPSRHVDYLSHEWREEDIWASWRHIVSQRSVYGQRSRLENASWRTWAKSKYRLRTVSPERLNWLKESDVTWLYGPLKPAQSHPITSTDSGRISTPLSKNSSFINKKPILKKRSVSEVMLQKSISTSSLVKQAAASVQAQGKKSPHRRLDRVSSDLFSSSTLPSNPPSREEIDYFTSRSATSETCTPSEGQTQKHLRFDEKVEQCIAVDCKDSGLDDDDDSGSDVEYNAHDSALMDSDSDEGLFMPDRSKRKKDAAQKAGRISRSNSNSGGQMIETLPATTLKSRTPSPDVDAPPQAQHHHVFGKNWGTPQLSPSPSLETLRPSRPSRNFLLAQEDDEDAGEEFSSTWSFGRSNPESSLGASAGSQPSMSAEDFNPTDGYDGIEGMRRTESGMFMPYDEDEDDIAAEGLFGRVSETFNTFRDIGHVIWNVGWRK